MFKNYTLLLLLSISLPVVAAEDVDDRKEESQVKSSKYKLSRHSQKPCPTEEDIQSYEKIYGNMHPHMREFYKIYGNCVKKGVDVLHVYGGEASDLSQATGLIRPYLPDYHALAFDQGEGGYWVYQSAKPLTFELYDTSNNIFIKDRRIKGLSAFLLYNFQSAE